MEPINFKHANVVYGKGQKEYEELPAYKSPDGQVVTKWQLTPEEIEQINETGVIYLSMLTFNKPLQPIYPMTENPFVNDEQK